MSGRILATGDADVQVLMSWTLTAGSPFHGLEVGARLRQRLGHRGQPSGAERARHERKVRKNNKVWVALKEFKLRYHSLDTRYLAVLTLWYS